MILELTISQLDIGVVTPQRAQEMGQLGYVQWLGALPGHTSYRQQAEHALAKAAPFRDTSPAVAVFCDLLNQSLTFPPRALPLALPLKQRRGGARARRAAM